MVVVVFVVECSGSVVDLSIYLFIYLSIYLSF